MLQNQVISLQTKPIPTQVNHTAPDGSEIRELVVVNSAGLAHCALPVGKTSSAVAHKTVDELWFFTKGLGEVWRKFEALEITVDVSPCVSINIPKGTCFQFRNTGDESLEFIIATAPRWPGPDEAYPVKGCWQEV